MCFLQLRCNQLLLELVPLREYRRESQLAFEAQQRELAAAREDAAMMRSMVCASSEVLSSGHRPRPRMSPQQNKEPEWQHTLRQQVGNATLLESACHVKCLHNHVLN